MASKKNARKRDAERRAATAARREKHFKLVVDRQGDPGFVQQTRTPTGRTISWNPNSEQGQQLNEALVEQRALFIKKFGREPGPGDPLFFDPNADEPTAIGADTEADMWKELLGVTEQAGLDPAYIHAWRELGYIITESNQHLFSAMEVEAYLDAVSRHMEEPVDGDDSEEGDEANVVNSATEDMMDDIFETNISLSLSTTRTDQPISPSHLENIQKTVTDILAADGMTVLAVEPCWNQNMPAVRAGPLEPENLQIEIAVGDGFVADRWRDNARAVAQALERIGLHVEYADAFGPAVDGASPVLGEWHDEMDS
jgi:hypothetical protein